jgi:hypothetical protein
MYVHCHHFLFDELFFGEKKLIFGLATVRRKVVVKSWLEKPLKTRQTVFSRTEKSGHGHEKKGGQQALTLIIFKRRRKGLKDGQLHARDRRSV